MTTATSRGVAWSGSSMMARQLVGLVSAAILARILTPDAYGLVAVVLAANAFAALFSELGIALTIVSAPQIDQRYLSSLMWLNLASGVVLSGTMIAAAESIASFFGQPTLVDLLRAGSLQFILSFGVVHRGLLRRSHRFKRIAQVELFSGLIAAVVAVVAAAVGLGAWSLIIGSLTGTLVESLGFWFADSFRPSFTVSREDLQRAFTYSAGVLGFNFVSYWSRNTDTLVIGRTDSATALGEYNRAYNLMMFPILLVGGSVERVLVPAMREKRTDRADLEAIWFRILHGSWGIALVAGVGLSSVAEPLVQVVYGDGWTGVVPLLLVLALASPAQVLARVAGLALQVEETTNRFFVIGVANTTIMVVCVLIGAAFGAKGVANGVLIASCISAVVTVVVVSRRLKTAIKQVAWPLLRTGSVIGVMWFVVYAVLVALPLGAAPLVSLLVSVTTGAVYVVTAMLVLDRVGFRAVRATLGT